METWSKELDFRYIGETYKTPIYVFSEMQLRKNVEAYLSWLQEPRRIIYPIKSNPSLEILTQLAEQGICVDCANEYEVYLAQISGFDNARIIYNSPVPNLNYAINLYQRGATIIIDSVSMLEEFSKLAQESLSYRGKLILHVIPKQATQHEHSESWHSKFGIPEEEIIILLRKYPIALYGLHVHLDAVDDPQRFKTLLINLHNLCDAINKEFSNKDKVKYIDLGLELSAQLGEKLSPYFRSDFEYAVETGPAFVGNTMGVVTRVAALKTMRGKKLAICDAGGYSHQILCENHAPLPHEGPDSVVGPLCFADDTLLPNTRLDEVQTGDYLFIQHCGAYCYSLSNHFNARSYKGMVAVQEDGSLRLANRAENIFLTPTIETYNWNRENSKSDSVNVDINRIKQLSSIYLHIQANQDQYEILEVRKLNEFTYKFKFSVRSAVNFVSTPFLIRLVGDASIISALLLANKATKDIPVLNDRCFVNYNQEVLSNRDDLHCIIRMSAISQRKRPEDKSLHVHFIIDEGLCTGSLRINFSL